MKIKGFAKSIVSITATVFILSVTAFAQSGGLVNGTRGIPYPNASGGTTVNETAVINASGQAATSTTSSVAVKAYIVVGGAGTSGNATLAMQGSIAPCKMDATASSVGGDYVINSPTTAGDCEATSSLPAAGDYVIGILHDSSTTSGSNALVEVDGFFVPSSGGVGTLFRLSTNCTVTGTTSGNCTGMSWSIAASALQTASCVVYGSTSAGSTVADLGFTGPASPTSVQIGGAGIEINPASGFGTAFAYANSTSGQITTFTLLIQNGTTAGTVQLQIKDNTGGDTATVNAGSYCIVF